MTRLFLELHATSLDNERNIASGHNDPDLSPAGERQAAQMGERYRDRKIEAVYSSDLLRARRTAEIAFGDRGVPIVLDERLRECNYGELNGQPASPMRTGRVNYVAQPYPGGESWAQASMRTIRCLKAIRAKGHAGNVVIVGHSAQYFALESYYSGAKLAELIARPWEWKEPWAWEAEL